MIRLTLPNGKAFYLEHSEIRVVKGTDYYTEVYHNVCGVVNRTSVKELPSRVMEIIKEAQDSEKRNAHL